MMAYVCGNPKQHLDSGKSTSLNTDELTCFFFYPFEACIYNLYIHTSRAIPSMYSLLARGSLTDHGGYVAMVDPHLRNARLPIWLKLVPPLLIDG